MAVPLVPFVGMPVLYRDPANPTIPVPGQVISWAAVPNGYTVVIANFATFLTETAVVWYQVDAGAPGSCWPNPQLPWA